MATAQIINAWKDGTMAHLAVRVAEAGGDQVEYIGSVPLAALVGLSAAQQKAALVAAVKAVRDTQQQAGNADLGLAGSVTI
jgi:hypothetical protein